MSETNSFQPYIDFLTRENSHVIAMPVHGDSWQIVCNADKNSFPPPLSAQDLAEKLTKALSTEDLPLTFRDTHEKYAVVSKYGELKHIYDAMAKLYWSTPDGLGFGNRAILSHMNQYIKENLDKVSWAAKLGGDSPDDNGPKTIPNRRGAIR